MIMIMIMMMAIIAADWIESEMANGFLIITIYSIVILTIRWYIFIIVIITIVVFILNFHRHVL